MSTDLDYAEALAETELILIASPDFLSSLQEDTFLPDQKHDSLQFHLKTVKLNRKMDLLFPNRATCKQSS